eukprot:PhM_4_TR841/c0_g1_i1/m.1965
MARCTSDDFSCRDMECFFTRCSICAPTPSSSWMRRSSAAFRSSCRARTVSIAEACRSPASSASFANDSTCWHSVSVSFWAFCRTRVISASSSMTLSPSSSTLRRSASSSCVTSNISALWRSSSSTSACSYAATWSRRLPRGVRRSPRADARRSLLFVLRILVFIAASATWIESSSSSSSSLPLLLLWCSLPTIDIIESETWRGGVPSPAADENALPRREFTAVDATDCSPSCSREESALTDRRDIVVAPASIAPVPVFVGAEAGRRTPAEAGDSKVVVAVVVAAWSSSSPCSPTAEELAPLARRFTGDRGDGVATMLARVDDLRA